MKNAVKRKCISCGKKELSKDEVGINLKLIGEDARNFYCLNCLADVNALECLEGLVKLQNCI